MFCTFGSLFLKANHSDLHGMDQLELTDGWYPIIAWPDNPLSKLIKSGVTGVGDKLRISGSCLVSSRPDKPLEAYKTSFLRIHYNGCHPVKWHENLGACPRPLPFVRLGMLHPNGGQVSRTLVCILRKYPLRYWGKLASGAHISRTPKAWEQACRAVEDRVAALEAEIQDDVQKNLLKMSTNGGKKIHQIGLEMLSKGTPLEICLSPEEQAELSK